MEREPLTPEAPPLSSPPPPFVFCLKLRNSFGAAHIHMSKFRNIFVDTK